MFASKAVIIALVLGLFSELLLPDSAEIKADLAQQKAAIKDRLVRTFGNEGAKLYILSFVQNPAALQKTSELAERNGQLESAMRNMELAIGLLEMHNADKQVIKRYNERLDKLKAAAKK